MSAPPLPSVPCRRCWKPIPPEQITRESDGVRYYLCTPCDEWTLVDPKGVLQGAAMRRDALDRGSRHERRKRERRA